MNANIDHLRCITKYCGRVHFMHPYFFCPTWLSFVNTSIVLNDGRDVVSETTYYLSSVMLNFSYLLIGKPDDMFHEPEHLCSYVA